MMSRVSTASLSLAATLSVQQTQSKLADAQKELSTGRHADVGATLGVSTGYTISLREERARLQALTDSNGPLAARLDVAQDALSTLSASVSNVLKAALAGRSNATAASSAVDAAKDALSGLPTILGASFDGVYLFGGENLDQPPLGDYFGTPTSATKAATDSAFETAFGFPPSDPQAANITAADMNSFLDGAFAQLFEPSAWANNWSSASDQNTSSRISPREFVDTSANANEEPIRKIAQAFTAIAGLGLENLSGDARNAVLARASDLLGNAVAGVTGLQSRLGIAQERVTTASERMTLQIDIIETDVGTLEGVDPSEVSIRVSALTTQMETAFALTARLSQMSLINYL